jgi:hypothetical protein
MGSGILLIRGLLEVFVTVLEPKYIMPADPKNKRLLESKLLVSAPAR